jgi:hypothetical protein
MPPKITNVRIEGLLEVDVMFALPDDTRVRECSRWEANVTAKFTEAILPRIGPSLFDERLQARERFIPLSGNPVERTAGSVERLGLQLEKNFAPPAHAADQARALKGSQVLGDRLAGEPRPGRQVRD